MEATSTPPPEDQGGRPRPETGQSSQPIVVPAWVAGDWLTALRIAGVAQLLLLAGATVVTIFALLATISASGLSFVPWGSTILTPIATVLRWAGGVAGAPFLFTAVLYTFLAYRLAMRWSGARTSELLTDRARTFAAAGKIAVVSSGILLAVAILLNTFASNALGGAPAFWVANTLDLTALVFFTLFVGAATALAALLNVGRTSLVNVLGLRLTAPPIVRFGLRGAGRVVLGGGLSLLVLHTLGSMLDDLSSGGLGLGGALSLLSINVAALMLQWLDTAVLLLVGATKFLHEGGFRWSPGAGVSGWMWLAIPVVLGAYLAGGVRAAQVARPGTQAEAAKAALLVGPFVAVVCVVVAFGWAGQPFIDDIIPIAVLLPALWGVVAVVGAWLWANQQGLETGIVTERAVAAATPDADTQTLPPSSDAERPEDPAPPPDQPERRQSVDGSTQPDVDLGSLPPPDTEPPARP